MQTGLTGIPALEAEMRDRLKEKNGEIARLKAEIEVQAHHNTAYRSQLESAENELIESKKERMRLSAELVKAQDAFTALQSTISNWITLANERGNNTKIAMDTVTQEHLRALHRLSKAQIDGEIGTLETVLKMMEEKEKP